MVMECAYINVNTMNRETVQFETVIIGLGKTGMSCIRYLSAKQKSIAVMDSRTTPPELDTLRREFPDVPVYLGYFDENILRSAREIIVSPGVPLAEPAIRSAMDSGVRAIGDIEIFCHQASAPIIGITGSNGKSTVASMLYQMILKSGMRAGLGGNIGVPVLDLLNTGPVDFYVLELSSFQLETVYSLNTIASVILNVCADHMDRYGDVHEYARVKESIYDGSDTIIINLDDEIVGRMNTAGREKLCYSLDEPDSGQLGIRTVSGQRMFACGKDILFPVSELNIYGEHNISNSLAALALGKTIGLPMDSMQAALASFTGLPHRCQWIANIDGVNWVNDSKGTNVGATCNAVRGLTVKKNIILIAGGEGKGADFTPLEDVAAQRLRCAVLIGRDARLMARSLDKLVPVSFATSMQAAVITASKLARKGDTILLSPACASFDMFSDFQERGDDFIRAVTDLQECGD